MKVGIFFHEKLAKRSWPIIGDKFKKFPKIVKELSTLENVTVYELEPVSENLLLKIHTREMIDRIKSYANYDAGVYGAGGCVMAAEKVWLGDIDSAITPGGCHHAGRNFAWGGCTFSGIAAAIVSLREKFGVKRFAILDTDSHHGDGTRDIFLGDRNVLHVCFCSHNTIEDGGTKIDVDVGWTTTDEEYLDKVKKEFISRAHKFRPNLILHFLGHDTAKGDYGDRGLTKDFFVELVKHVMKCAEKVCGGKYLIMMGGGARRDVAEYIFPRIVKVLAGVRQPISEVK